MIITAGELLAEFVSRTPGCGLSRLAEFEGPFPSGAPAIFIDQAARMGAKTRMYGGVGQDGFGKVIVERLASHGVDCSSVARNEGVTTGVAFVSYYPDGSRTFIYHIDHSAAESFETSPLPDTPPIYHISGAALGNPVLREKLLRLADDVLAADGRITLDPNIRPELFREQAAWDAVNRLLDACWMALPSEADIEALYPGVAAAEAIGRLHGRGAAVVALKKGAEGAEISDGARVISVPAFAVEEIDPTGAGDCFCGTFVALVEQGVSLEEAGLRASAAGALAVTKRGPMEGNSMPDEIMALIASQGRS